MEIDLKYVQVQRLYQSKRAKKYYKYSMQRKPIGGIDLRGVTSMKALRMVWNESIGLHGQFALMSRSMRNKRFHKSIGTINVDKHGTTFQDRCCALFVIMRKQREES